MALTMTQALGKITVGTPDDSPWSSSSITFSLPSKTSRSIVRAYPSPQYASLHRQQSGFPFPRMPVGSSLAAPQATLPTSRSSVEWNHSTPNVQSGYVRYPSLHRNAKKTRDLAHGGQGFAHQSMIPPPQSSTHSLPPPSLSMASHPGRTADGATLAAPILETASAPAVILLRETAEQKLRLKVSHEAPAVNWMKLPPPTLERVLAHLRATHLEQRSRSCSTCHMRDLDALQRSCKTWSVAAQRNLYSNIAVVGNDSPLKLRKLQTKRGARLTLLRRTLRKRPMIASLVTNLHVPDPIIPLYMVDGSPNPEYDDYLCLLASVVMCCPNLETFTGFHPFYNHTFDRLTHALSTRPRLKQHVWILAENDDVSERSQKQLSPGLLDQHQVRQFQQYHKQWSNLETLMLCSPASLGVLEHNLLLEVLHSLPALKNLCVSSFDADDFNNAILLELPRLLSLRMEECKGVTDVGLACWASSPASISMQRLTLIHQNINSLVTISKLFSGLERLKKFSIMQSDVTPSLPVEVVVFPPLFASQTIERIHWDLGHERFASNSQLDLDMGIGDLGNYGYITPNTHLALSILHHGFPALKTLRAPRDIFPLGALQSVCRPAKNANMILPHDIYSTYNLDTPPKSNSLQVARIRAQNLINHSTAANKSTVNVPMIHRTPENSPKEHLKRPISTAASSRSSGTNRSTTSTDLAETSIHQAQPSNRQAKQRQSRRLSQIRNCQQHPNQRFSQPTLALGSYNHKHLKVHEFSLPTFNGRVAIHISDAGQVFQPPKFDLVPDYPGRDASGGLAMWEELLKIKERVRAMQIKNEEEEPVRDGCVGAWNKGRTERRSGEGDKWRHTERERMSRGKQVIIEDFF